MADFIELKRAGTALKACCPFHGERTPSFTVSPTRGTFKCFGCSKGGDSITFVMEHAKKSYPDALRYLAQKYGIPVEESAQTDRSEKSDKRGEIRATLAALQAHLSAEKPGAKEPSPGRAYWLKRGFTEATVDLYGIGYCSEVSAPLIAAESLQAAGVANDKGNLSYYKRATLPIHDHRGNIVSMVGRSLEPTDKGDKYLNGRTVEGVYEKGKYLFNLHRAHRAIEASREIWIVEGYADSMALTQLGKPQNVALCGVELSDAHLAVLKQYNGTRPLRFMLGLDNQKAEIERKDWPTDKKEAAVRAWEEKHWGMVGKLLAIGEVRLVEWPKGCKDAGEIVERSLNFSLTKNEDAIEAYINSVISKAWQETASPIEKSEFQERVAAMISKVEKDSARDIYINKLCNLLEMPSKRLEEMVKKARSKGKVEEQQGPTKEPTFIKVADEYRQRIARKDPKSGQVTIGYEARKVGELKEEFGSGFVKNIPRFHGWVTEPSHTEYSRTISYTHENVLYRFFNRYQPPPYQPKPFDIPDAYKAAPMTFDMEDIPEIRHSAKFLKHLFRSDRELNVAVDMIALKWLSPRTKVRSLALVSSEEGTGKSTFIDWMLKIFGQNSTKTEIQRMTDNFNSLMSGRVVVGIEETKDEKGNVENRLKDMITGYETVTRRMYQEAVVEENFTWYIFASNHEDSFMKVGATTTRFFVVKVNPLEGIDPDFADKLYREIPYFLYFLEKRGALYPKEDRLWHRQELVENDALVKLRQSSKDIVQQNMEELVQSIFLRCELALPYIRYSSEYLKVLMQGWGGRLYEQKTPNYFYKVATTDLRCVYKDKPTTFSLIELSNLHHADFLTQTTWDYKVSRPKARFIEFPIFRFCTPGDVATNYPLEKAQNLITVMESDMAYITSTYGQQPVAWLESLKLSITEAHGTPF